MPYELTWTAPDGIEQREVHSRANLAFVIATRLIKDGNAPVVRDTSDGAIYTGQAILDFYSTVESGEDPLFTTRLPRETINRIDLWAKTRALTRSAAVRELVELGLAGMPKSRKP